MKITIKETDVCSKDATNLICELNQALLSITGNSGAASFDTASMKNNRSAFLVAYLDDTPAGCGAILEISNEIAELKRVYARPNKEGIAHKIVEALEHKARDYGYQTIRLETRKVNQHAADFYAGCGYSICRNYGKYKDRGDAICFIKQL